MFSKPTIKISVRDLVSYVLRKGDISVGYFQRTRLVEGTKGHQYVQKQRGPSYQKEVSISELIERDQCNVYLGGRIDGVFVKNNQTFIEEIKTTQQNLTKLLIGSNESYWAQAICYGYVYSKQNNLNEINIQLTYFNLDSRNTKTFTKKFSFKDIEKQCLEIVDKYLNWALILYNWIETRNDSIKTIQFPFPSFRKGQDKMVKVVNDVIKNGKKLYCQAPTGIGKTVAALYPSIKSMNNGLDSKIFYLTAKTTTRFIAEETINILRNNSLKIKTLTITAKAKTCFKEKDYCDPVYCEYAKGHFDRVNGAIEEIYQHDGFTRDLIEKYAQKHKICPFEFSLDLSLWSDIIICDYNYAFDPRVYLRRFFMEEKGDFTFLIDEAHNLVDRAREMFSASLLKKPMLDLRRLTKTELPELSKSLDVLNQFMITIRKKCEKSNNYSFVQKSSPSKNFISALKIFSKVAEDWLELNIDTAYRDKLLEFYFEIRNFLRVIEDYDSSFVTYYQRFGNEVKVKLYCLDPSKLLQNALKRGKSAIFYSATLTPLDYFQELLGGDHTSAKLLLNSPFPRENLGLFSIDYLSTRFKMRELSYHEISKIIEIVSRSKIGNFLIFFPSYAYMEEVFNEVKENNLDARIIIQKPSMDENEREEFLREFSAFGETTLLGFVVMGGIFGEGIDLIGEKLSGAVVVGVGLPKICLEQDLLKEYYNQLNGKGFHYAYTYPGMNRVLQAVGRVIRTESDKGIVLLIGDRYSSTTYLSLFPPYWGEVPKIRGNEDLATKLDHFWKNSKIK